MSEKEFFDFLELYKMFSLKDHYVETFRFRESIKNRIVTQTIHLRGSGVISIYLTCIDWRIKERHYLFNLYDNNLEEKILETILEFYSSEGITPTNLLPYVRDKKIVCILE